jgi:hypothetical protein
MSSKQVAENVPEPELPDVSVTSQVKFVHFEARVPAVDVDVFQSPPSREIDTSDGSATVDLLKNSKHAVLKKAASTTAGSPKRVMLASP